MNESNKFVTMKVKKNVKKFVKIESAKQGVTMSDYLKKKLDMEARKAEEDLRRRRKGGFKLAF